MNNRIPKMIHYCWFGNNPKPEIVLKCIESWRKYFPDYEIIEWNEKNYDVNKELYMREAYSCKKWAFVSDYARFDVLYEYGGIYFDTDVEVLKEFPQEVLCNQAFTGVESTKIISPGLVFGCAPKLDIVKKIIESYKNTHFVVEGKLDTTTINQRVTQIFEKHGYVINGKEQLVAGVRVYRDDVFCGYDLDIMEPFITSNTLSIHHYNASWETKTDGTKRKLQGILKRIIGINGYKKILNIIRKLKKGSKRG